jgi:hypothetical protein
MRVLGGSRVNIDVGLAPYAQTRVHTYLHVCLRVRASDRARMCVLIGPNVSSAAYCVLIGFCICAWTLGNVLYYIAARLVLTRYKGMCLRVCPCVCVVFVYCVVIAIQIHSGWRQVGASDVALLESSGPVTHALHYDTTSTYCTHLFDLFTKQQRALFKLKGP